MLSIIILRETGFVNKKECPTHFIVTPLLSRLQEVLIIRLDTIRYICTIGKQHICLL